MTKKSNLANDWNAEVRKSDYTSELGEEQLNTVSGGAVLIPTGGNPFTTTRVILRMGLSPFFRRR